MRKTVVLAFAAVLLAACGSDDDGDEDPDTPPVEESGAAALPPAEDATPAADATPAPAEDATPAADATPAPAADATPADADVEMTTIGALGFDLPIEIPPEIPAPADAAYIGENELATPYRAVQFSTAMDPDALTAELQAFADATGAAFDEAIGQVTYRTELGDGLWSVYAWVRTNEDQTILEIGTIAVAE